MNPAEHPLWMPHALWGLALAGLAAALMIAARDRLTRRRLRFTLLVTIAFLALHSALYAMPLVATSHRHLIEGLEAMLLALALTNAIVTLVFNPWLSKSGGDRAPSIVQDVLVVALIGGVAYSVFGERVLGASIGAAAALALGLQDQLGNIFAGLAIQIERPFRVGHWITVTNNEGRVVEVTWRATKLRTKNGNLVIVPNSVVSREPITNYSEPTVPTRIWVDVGASYHSPPNEVRDALLTAVGRVPAVLREPPADVLLTDFGGSAVVYRARFWITDFEHDVVIAQDVRTAIYYEFGRRGIEIPWPIQVQYWRREARPDLAARHADFGKTIATVAVLTTLPADAHRALAETAHERLYADGESIVTEGDPGNSMFVVRHGRVAVTIGPERREVATIGAGGYFGEMSLLTGDPRTATVVARGDCTVLELSADAFGAYVRTHPGVIDLLAEPAAARRRSLDEARAATSAPAAEPKSLARRMRKFFGLE